MIVLTGLSALREISLCTVIKPIQPILMLDRERGLTTLCCMQPIGLHLGKRFAYGGRVSLAVKQP